MHAVSCADPKSLLLKVPAVTHEPIVINVDSETVENLETLVGIRCRGNYERKEN